MKRCLIIFAFTSLIESYSVAQSENETATVLKQAVTCCDKIQGSSLIYHSCPDFEVLYKGSINHWRNGISLIREGKISENEQLVYVLSMQGLDFKTYLGFLDEIYRLYRTKAISKKIFIRAIFPSFDWNTFLEENFKEPRVVMFLTTLKQDPSLADHYNDFDYILKGKAALDVQNQRDLGQIR